MRGTTACRWPGELDILDVLSDDLAILGLKVLEPQTNRHFMYQKWYVQSTRFLASPFARAVRRSASGKSNRNFRITRRSPFFVLLRVNHFVMAITAAEPPTR
jgi:hypothetical protein